jgi:hypothetical protein
MTAPFIDDDDDGTITPTATPGRSSLSSVITPKGVVSARIRQLTEPQVSELLEERERENTWQG